MSDHEYLVRNAFEADAPIDEETPDPTRGGSGRSKAKEAPVEAALRLARVGIKVFPGRPKSEGPNKKAKAPLIAGGFKAATTDEAIILGWWEKWPDALIGVPTGAESGFFVFDKDIKNGAQGEASLAAFEAEHGPLPETPRVRTASRGEQYYFKWPAGKDLRCSNSKIAPGIDIKANGGYVIVPPSVLIDDTGQPAGTYEFIDGGRELHEQILAASEPPEWLVLLIEKKPKPEAADSRARVAATDSWAARKLEQLCEDVAKAQEGARNDALNKAAFAAGQDVALGALDRGAAEAALLTAAAACGLREGEALATIASGVEAGLAKAPEQPPFVDWKGRGIVDAQSTFNVMAPCGGTHSQHATRSLGLRDITNSMTGPSPSFGGVPTNSSSASPRSSCGRASSMPAYSTSCIRCGSTSTPSHGIALGGWTLG